MGGTVEEKPSEDSAPPVSFLKLFRFANWWEIILIIFALFCGALCAGTKPLMLIIYGEFTTLLIDRALTKGVVSSTKLMHLLGGAEVIHNATDEQLIEAIENDSLSYLIWLMLLGLIQLITQMVFVDIFNKIAMRQITRIRIQFFRSILCQEMSWYDKTTDMNFASRITDDIDKIRDGIAERLGNCASLVFGFVICVAVSISYGWKLSLVVLALVPVLVLCNHFVLKIQASLTTKELDSYSSAGSVAEEVLRSIRTVVAFGGENKEYVRFSSRLQGAQKSGKTKGVFSGIGEGILQFFLYGCSAIAIWYGVSLILDDRDKPNEEKEYTPAVLMIAFFGILVGADNLAKSAPMLEAFSTAKGSAATIFGVIDRKSKINPLSTEGKTMTHGIKGDIEFEDVQFRYPSRPDVQVLKKFNLTVKAGETVALVGHSGCGKSTIVQLLQRFYDPDSGNVFIDDHDIKSMNIAWLRSNIAVVGQEPVLFATSIENNIRYGRTNATQAEIEEAARAVGVHDFIRRLPDGYQTQVGELGSQMSGGQKQRIAIARAIIQNPKILLLDEATSALDPHTGKLVEEMLGKVAKGKTTIIVTHKLSSIRKADQIVLMDKGMILEKGTHVNLMNQEGKYFGMIKADAAYKKLSLKENENADEDDKDTLFVDNEDERKHSRVSAKDIVHFQKSKGDDPEIGAEEEKINQWAVFKRILGLAKPEWGFIFMGCFGAAVVGASYPVFAVVMGNVYGALGLPDPDDVYSETNIMCICFLVVGLVVAVSVFLQNYMLNLTGVILTTKLRKDVFQSMTKQEMAWFDEESHSVGALCAFLAGDAANVRAAVGQPIGGIIGSFTTLICGVAVAMFYSWKLALVCLCFVPLVLFSVIFETKFMTSSMLKEKSAIERATQIATEAISNIRTVASLRQEEDIISRYTKEIMAVEVAVKKKLSFRGFVSAITQAIPMFAYAIALYYGGILVAREGMAYQNLIKVSDSLIYAAMMMGQSLAFVSTLSAAFVAGSRLFKVIDRKPKIISPKHVGERRKRNNESVVNYNKVNFRYPSRPDALILDNLDLEVLSGKTVALVGPSGCGKSTCVQLLQRLYDPDGGHILYNQQDISHDMRIPELRSQIGIVSQEPHLFDKSIAENIAYGDNSREVHMEEIIEAAKMANIHSFIASLPLGYETSLGSKGTQLSGGQKQRIAIARALVRNPKILLLDEATSALDTESEKIVQQALDLAKTGRTCLVIAHRLTTIVDADLICVVQAGKIAEMGTHEELLEKQGLYSQLHAIQSSL